MVLLPLRPSARRRIGRGGRSRHHLRFRGHGCGRTTTGAMVRPGRSNLAGSALCLEQAVRNGVGWTNLTAETASAWRSYCTRPAWGRLPSPDDSPFQAFLRITVPLIMPGIIAGGPSFVTAINELSSSRSSMLAAR
jgi:hypothetical protein